MDGERGEHMSMIARHRALMGTTSRSSWPVVITALMNQRMICNNGTIMSKHDWRSSGYIPIPSGATQVKLENTDPNSSKAGRLGLTISNEQMTGITMITPPINQVFTGVYVALLPGYSYIYASRINADESDVIITFSNE